MTAKARELCAYAARLSARERQAVLVSCPMKAAETHQQLKTLIQMGRDSIHHRVDQAVADVHEFSNGDLVVPQVVDEPPTEAHAAACVLWSMTDESSPGALAGALTEAGSFSPRTVSITDKAPDGEVTAAALNRRAKVPGSPAALAFNLALSLIILNGVPGSVLGMLVDPVANLGRASHVVIVGSTACTKLAPSLGVTVDPALALAKTAGAKCPQSGQYSGADTTHWEATPHRRAKNQRKELAMDW
eukprot:6473923-Amphidinium_carterae.2